MKTIYLDQGSTSFPKAPGVGKAMMDLLENGGYNIGRGGYADAYDLAERILGVREQIRDFFGFDRDSHVVFTPNVTNSLNCMIRGLFEGSGHLVTTAMEHNAVARPVAAAARRGVTVSHAAADICGFVDPAAVEALLRPETRAVVMIHASNVCGTIQPIAEIGALCRDREIFFIVDAAQTAGTIPIDMQAMHIDGLAFTGHKSLLGPQGIGGFLATEELAAAMEPFLHGGTGSVSDTLEMPAFLPDKFEVGTLNLPGIVGLSAALDYIAATGLDAIRERELDLAARFLDGVQALPRAKNIGLPGREGRCPIVSLDFPERDNAEIAYLLDRDFGIMTRCGLHCAPLAHRSLGTFPSGTVRFAFGHRTTEEEVDAALAALADLTA